MIHNTTQQCGTFNLPNILVYPNFLSFDDTESINDIFSYVINHYGDDGLSVLIYRIPSEDDVYIMCGDWRGNKIDLIENLTYGEFIIHLQGLWLINNKLNFDWILLQGKIDMPLYLSEYSFIDYNKGYDSKGKGKGKSIPPPPPLTPLMALKPLNSFDNLLRLGISKEAIEHKKKLNNTFDILSVTLQKTPQNIIKKEPKDELLEELKKKLQKKII